MKGAAVILLIFQGLYSHGQGYELIEETKPSVSSQPHGGSVLVIPFAPQMYFCEGDQFICESNNITPLDLSEYIRTALHSSLTSKLGGANLYDKNDADKVEDLRSVYGQIKYQEVYQPVALFHQEYADDKVKKFVGLKDLKSPKDLVSSKSRASDHHHRYFKATFSDEDKASQLSEGYGADYFLVITHFEMESRYDDCQDMHQNIAQRDMYVHYSLIDKDNLYVDGGVACLTFDSKSSELKVLIDDNFAILGGLIAQEVKTHTAGY